MKNPCRDHLSKIWMNQTKENSNYIQHITSRHEDCTIQKVVKGEDVCNQEYEF
jgi:hypothetical protein